MIKDKTKYALELKNITKTFGTTVANNKVSLKIKKGLVHIIAGENGAGKSTLMNTIFGLHQPDSGEIFIDGKKTIIKDAKHANDLGIGMVHQHFKQVDIFTSLENIILGHEPTKGKYIIDKEATRKTLKNSMKEFDLFIPLETTVENLTIGQQQKLEILKLLHRKSDILILDEPTAVLTPSEIKNLIKTVYEFKKKGKTIIIITHKLEEIKALADNITIIRHGKVVDEFTRKQLTSDRLTKAIVGKKLPKVERTIVKPGKVVLEVNKINAKKIGFKDVLALKDVSFTLKEGEIVVVAGVQGNGQKELALALTGMIKPKSGSIIFEGKNVTNSSAKERYRIGFSHIPADRHRHGLLLNWTPVENAVLQDIDIKPYSNGQVLNWKAMKEHANKIVKQFDVRGTQKLREKVSGLSGGNQQKFIVGRELIRENTKLLIITQPTRGLDIGSIQYIHSQILKAKKEKKAILLISYELSEVLTLADRVIVFNEGTITGELSRKEVTQEKIGKLMTSKQSKGVN